MASMKDRVRAARIATAKLLAEMTKAKRAYRHIKRHFNNDEMDALESMSESCGRASYDEPYEQSSPYD